MPYVPKNTYSAKPMTGPDSIEIVKANLHNLKNITCSLPHGRITVVTGPSGSGKSSLVFDTVWTEAQRRFTESLPSYVRQVLGVWEKPDVEHIAGLIPAVALQARTGAGTPRSTVGTATEIYHYLRLFFTHAGIPYCPSCGQILERTPREAIIAALMDLPEKSRIHVAAPLGSWTARELPAIWESLRKEGFLRILIDDTTYDLDTPPPDLKGRQEAAAVVDRLVIQPKTRQRLAEAVETALSKSGGFVKAILPGEPPLLFCEKYLCPRCNKSVPPFTPASFSFNNPRGACPRCKGLGITGGKTNRKSTRPAGAPTQLTATCPACGGKRLTKESLSVKVDGHSIFDLSSLSIAALAGFFTEQRFEEKNPALSAVVGEIKKRLALLLNLGLSYLSLARSVPTLSAGEHQRLRLAMQIGADLGGILYLLDEPTIGLHPAETSQLLSILRALCDKGNTIVLIEHDLDVIRKADHVVDLGPGAGPEGGTIIASGTPHEIMSSKTSITGEYLSGKSAFEPAAGEAPRSFIDLKGASTHNLQNIDARFPVELLTCICGVSGSGKSSLLLDTLHPALEDHLNRRRKKTTPAQRGYTELRIERGIKRSVVIDQSPITRTARSCPATYTGLFTHVRTFFAQLPMAKVRGYGPNRFSFNAKGGRCEVCRGEGVKRIEMHFMPDTIIPCESCLGKRFNAETLDVRYRGLNIADVLDLSIREARGLFTALPRVAEQLRFLDEIGLGYLTLGQRAATLSGGEAQRLKLSRELARNTTGTVFILDEPTTGLHPHDIALLLRVFADLILRQNTVIVIEHNVELARAADYVIELGPGGGPDGGAIIAEGTPQEIAAASTSRIGRFLKPHGS